MDTEYNNEEYNTYLLYKNQLKDHKYLYNGGESNPINTDNINNITYIEAKDKDPNTIQFIDKLTELNLLLTNFNSITSYKNHIKYIIDNESKFNYGIKETQAPETKAPETKAPETKAPETQAPETKAPETKAPETKAPETQAPETQAPKLEEKQKGGVQDKGWDLLQIKNLNDLDVIKLYQNRNENKNKIISEQEIKNGILEPCSLDELCNNKKYRLLNTYKDIEIIKNNIKQIPNYNIKELYYNNEKFESNKTKITKNDYDYYNNYINIIQTKKQEIITNLNNIQTKIIDIIKEYKIKKINQINNLNNNTTERDKQILELNEQINNFKIQLNKQMGHAGLSMFRGGDESSIGINYLFILSVTIPIGVLILFFYLLKYDNNLILSIFVLIIYICIFCCSFIPYQINIDTNLDEWWINFIDIPIQWVFVFIICVFSLVYYDILNYNTKKDNNCKKCDEKNFYNSIINYLKNITFNTYNFLIKGVLLIVIPVIIHFTSNANMFLFNIRNISITAAIILLGICGYNQYKERDSKHNDIFPLIKYIFIIGFVIASFITKEMRTLSIGLIFIMIYIFSYLYSRFVINVADKYKGIVLIMGSIALLIIKLLFIPDFNPTIDNIIYTVIVIIAIGLFLWGIKNLVKFREFNKNIN